MAAILTRRDDAFSRQLILWTSFVSALWLSLIYFPGVFFSDSFARWDTLRHLVRTGGASKYLDTALPSLWMGVTYLATGNKAAITFVQSCLFFYSSLLLIAKVGRFKSGWILIPSVLFVFFPLFQGYSVFNEPCIGTIIGLNFFLILLSRQREADRPLHHVIDGFLYLLVFSTIFGFRSNTITILPVVLFVLWKRPHLRNTRLIPLVALAVALVFLLSLPFALSQWRHVERRELVALGVAWETVQIAKRIHDPQYDRYLDYAGAVEGATRNAMANVEESEWRGFLGPQGLRFDRIMTPAISRRIMADYVRLIYAHPVEFAANKIYVWGRVLGLSAPLAFLEFQRDWKTKLAQDGFRSTPVRDRAIDDVNRFMTSWGSLRRPFLVFLAGLSCLGLSWRYFRHDVCFMGVMYCTALSYYGAFLITTQSFEFRYFFPSFFLVAVMVLVVVTKAIELLAGHFTAPGSLPRE